MMEAVRLNKYLSDHDVCSRREADRLIESGQVTVNGTVAVAGMKVTDADEILVRGRRVQAEKSEKVIFALYKPAGVVSTARHFAGEQNVVELVHYSSRLYPVGRLDKDSEGLILLTNDGAFMKEATDAANRHEKEYDVLVNKEIDEEFARRMSKGLFLEELNKRTSPCKIVKTGEKRFRITLIQGLNRQIRRMCEICGYKVVSLKRIRFMNIVLGDMNAGEYRLIEGEERDRLLKAAFGGKKNHKPTAAGAGPARHKPSGADTRSSAQAPARYKPSGADTRSSAQAPSRHKPSGADTRSFAQAPARHKPSGADTRSSAQAPARKAGSSKKRTGGQR